MGIKSEWIQPLGKVTKNGNYFNIAIYPTLMETAYSKNHGYYERGYRNGAFQEMVATVKQIPGRRWNSNDSVWEVPEAEKDAVYHFALKYWRKRSIPTHSGWLYPLTFDAGKGLKEA